MFTVGIFCRKMYIIGHGTNRLDLGRRHKAMELTSRDGHRDVLSRECTAYVPQ